MQDGSDNGERPVGAEHRKLEMGLCRPVLCRGAAKHRWIPAGFGAAVHACGSWYLRPDLPQLVTGWLSPLLRSQSGLFGLCVPSLVVLCG